MMQIIGQLQSFQYTDYDIFTCCILTHGSRGNIYTSDNIPVDIYKDIIYKICTEALQDKPKLFVIQACQEEINQNEKSFDNIKLDNDTTLNRYLMVAMSTTPLNLSFRLDKAGSWFIRDLVDEFSNRDTTSTDIYQLMNNVNYKVTRRCGPYKNKTVTQTPELRITVMRPLYLKRLEKPSPILKLNCADAINCPLLFSLVENFPIKPDIYLV
ncbi:caspase-8-like [Centruroides sculpturatus]|uniref:caspase-8-like n=1 Tax=Centruroides sculpturatus TaxID=218467 RepID=UPI000C6D85A4|nr:caspase-8-like [Centruroides sculpturatus]